MLCTSRGETGSSRGASRVACEPDAQTIYRCIDQERDYQNNPKAFARDVLRFEIALEGVKFLRSLKYAPRDAALTTASVPSAIAATPAAVNAVSTPTPLAGAAAAAPAAPGAPVAPPVASTATATIPEVPTAIAAATPPAVTAVSASTKHLEEPLLLLQ